MSRKRIPHEVDTAVIEENAQSLEVATFAKTLNSLLVEKNVHQDDMAQALGIATGSISSWRNGKKEPRLSMIIKIADYLGVDCHYLMTGIQSENYVCSNDLGLSETAIRKLKEFQFMPIFADTINNFIASDCFRQIIAFVYHFRENITEAATMSEDPAAEPPDIQRYFSSADLAEYRATKNLSHYFDLIKDEELSKSSTLVKTSNGYQLRSEFKNKTGEGK